MNIYVDESGSINNRIPNNKHFIISLIHVHNKKRLDRAYKRFISSNLETLKTLDQEKTDPRTGKVLKSGNKMFSDEKFIELKGSQFSPGMKLKFVDFFSLNHHFDIYFIKIDNTKLTDKFCSNTSRVFNFSLKIALEYLIKNGFLPDEDCNLQLDERNEKTETKHFLENYLNTELSLNSSINGNFNVTYYDSANNKAIQIADVFANLYYSELQNNNYTEQLNTLKEKGILKFIFEFPK